MNTYQMHTLALLFFFFFLFHHILTPTVIPLSVLSEFLIIFFCVGLSDSHPGSSAHFLTGFLMVCHTDATDPALLYNVLLYMYMCMHMVVHILKLRSLHMHLVRYFNRSSS